jgi:2'-5' RNA ligase
VRLFAAVWPPQGVVSWLETLPMAPVPGVRRTAPVQWHVTLAFYGEVADRELDALIAALGEGVRAVKRPLHASVGDRTCRLGRNVLALPVTGLEPLAEAVTAATRRWIHEDRPFRGHLTLARARRDSPGVPRSLVDVGLDRDGSRATDATSWTVGEACLVLSSPGPSGHDYRTLTAVQLGGAATGC